MSAQILRFPQGAARPPRPPVCLASIGSPDVRSQLATKFADHYLPIVQVSLELIEADEQDFEARCRQMLDVEGVEWLGRRLKADLDDGLAIVVASHEPALLAAIGAREVRLGAPRA